MDRITDWRVGERGHGYIGATELLWILLIFAWPTVGGIVGGLIGCFWFTWWKSMLIGTVAGMMINLAYLFVLDSCG